MFWTRYFFFRNFSQFSLKQFHVNEKLAGLYFTDLIAQQLAKPVVASNDCASKNALALSQSPATVQDDFTLLLRRACRLLND